MFQSIFLLRFYIFTFLYFYIFTFLYFYIFNSDTQSNYMSLHSQQPNTIQCNDYRRTHVS